MDTPELDEDFSEEIISELDRDLIDNYNSNEIQTESEIYPNANVKPDGNTGHHVGSKLFQLPLTRVRNLMKLDPDVSIASNEAVFVVARCSELFIESLVREAYTYTIQAKKKTVQKKDVDLAVCSVDSLMFLDGAINM